jgi:hypothetical protein
MEALSLGVGLLDSRADLRGVLVLRKYAQKSVRRMARVRIVRRWSLPLT